MGKLVLTRRAGESVIVREANGRDWKLSVRRTPGLLGMTTTHITLSNSDYNWTSCEHKYLSEGQSISFAGGSLELRPARCPSQAILAFDFPRDVTILRTEIA